MKPNTLKLLFDFIPLLSFYVVQKLLHCQLMQPLGSTGPRSCGKYISTNSMNWCQYFSVNYETSRLQTEIRLGGGWRPNTRACNWGFHGSVSLISGALKWRCDVWKPSVWSQRAPRDLMLGFCASETPPGQFDGVFAERHGNINTPI